MTFTLMDAEAKPSTLQIKLYNVKKLIEALKLDMNYDMKERQLLRHDLLDMLGKLYEDLQLPDEISLGGSGSDVELFELGPNPERDWLAYVSDLYDELAQMMLPRRRRLVRPRPVDDEEETIASRVTAWRTPSARVPSGTYRGVPWRGYPQLQRLIQQFHTWTTDPDDWVSPTRVILPRVFIDVDGIRPISCEGIDLEMFFTTSVPCVNPSGCTVPPSLERTLPLCGPQTPIRILPGLCRYLAFWGLEQPKKKRATPSGCGNAREPLPQNQTRAGTAKPKARDSV